MRCKACIGYCIAIHSLQCMYCNCIVCQIRCDPIPYVHETRPVFQHFDTYYDQFELGKILPYKFRSCWPPLQHNSNTVRCTITTFTATFWTAVTHFIAGDFCVQKIILTFLLKRSTNQPTCTHYRGRTQSGLMDAGGRGRE